MLWENTMINNVSNMEENCDVNECTSLISNSFTLDSGGSSRPAPTARRINEQRVRNMQRHRLSFLNDENATVLGMENNGDEVIQNDVVGVTPKSSKRMLVDDMSLYEQENAPHSPLPCIDSPCSHVDDVEDEDEGTDNLFARTAERSPVIFKIIEAKSSTSSNPKRSFEDINTNSMDSGYGHSTGQFRFAQPTRMAPRRLDSGISVSPLTNSALSSTSSAPKTAKSFSVFNSCSSQGSMESMIDEDYMDLFEMESMDCGNNANEMPSNISSLISGAIKATSSLKTPERFAACGKPKVRRCLNLDDSPAVVLSSPAQTNCTATSLEDELSGILTPRKSQNHLSPLIIPTGNKCFKRPEPLSFSPVQSKRYKSEMFAKTANPRLEQFQFPSQNATENKENKTAHEILAEKRTPLLRAVSMNDDMIMTALSRSSTEPDLIGDFSKPFCLPLMDGKHKDLKAISVHTMARLVSGNFDESVASFKIIDCRYPYEFEGGHIRGAKNLYTQEQILAELVSNKSEATIDEEPKRNILVFHCEFSSERGPKLSRFLRNHDRNCNESLYPALHYPEIYLLNGGYKDFFESYPELCDPQQYRTMLDQEYVDDYKHFRAKTKSWNGDNGRSTVLNRNKSRSRLLL